MKDEKKSRWNNENIFIKTSFSSNNMKKSISKNQNQNLKPLTGNNYLENLIKNQKSEKIKTTNNFDINKLMENEILKS